jgi:CsoR family transcriptional regulator, copper-sensing transcriptional repressor
MSKLNDPIKKKALKARLARVEGQLRGLQKSLDGEANCELIAQQLSASRKALDKAFFVMVACVIEQGEVPAHHVGEMLSKYA